MEANVPNPSIDAINTKFKSLIETLPKHIQNQLQKKKVYVGFRLFDGLIIEVDKDETGMTTFIVSDSTVIEEYSLSGIYTIVETIDALYIIAPLRNQIRGKAFIGSVETTPKLNEEITVHIYTCNDGNVGAGMCCGNVDSLIDIGDNVYIIYVNNCFYAVLNGCTFDNSMVEQEPDMNEEQCYYYN